MFYIYANGVFCGTSETWVDLPPPYEMTTNPPPEPEKPKPTPVSTKPLIDTPEVLTDVELDKVKSKIIDPTVAKLVEILYHQTVGNKAKIPGLFKQLRESLDYGGAASPNPNPSKGS